MKTSMQTSLEIHGDEAGLTRAVLDENIQTSKKVSTAAITNAQAKFLACLLAAAALPVRGAAEANCLGWYTLTMTGILTTVDRVTAAAESEFYLKLENIVLRTQNRDAAILSRRKESARLTNDTLTPNWN